MFTNRHSKRSKAVTRKHFINKGGRIGFSNSFSTYSNPPSNMMTAADRRFAKSRAENYKTRDLQYNRFLNNLDTNKPQTNLASRLYYENKDRQNSWRPSSRYSRTYRNRGGRKTKKQKNIY